ncbi:MAG TPA: hypothetical protein VFA99_06730 [Acidobacteriaceae bacterium]|nr:hypothetical protein [Acidobacteriaceae bacterium]
MDETTQPGTGHAGETHHGAVHATHHGTIHLPAPTMWPFLMAMGVTLIFFSLVTSPWVMWLGIVLTVGPAIGWFRAVLPHEQHVDVEVDTAVVEIEPSREGVARIEVDETHRAQLPLQTFTFASGIKGGIAGGIAMVIPAELYGIIRFHSVWYVVNLLGGAGVGGWTNPTMYQLTHFKLSAFITANIIQGVVTLLVGILYGAMLPIWPRRPIVLGGIIAPVLWTGVLHSALGIVNPFLQEKIDWWSFLAAQIIFGVVAGYTVKRLGRLERLRQLPLEVRLGLETPGLHPPGEPGESNSGDAGQEPKP